MEQFYFPPPFLYIIAPTRDLVRAWERHAAGLKEEKVISFFSSFLIISWKNIFILNLFYTSTGDFKCERGAYDIYGQSWPNTGKFDKIAFSVSDDVYIIGIIVASTVDFINVQITAKLTDIAGNVLATTSTYGAFLSAGLYMFFDQPYRITAGQQYIAATQVYDPPSSYPSLIQVTNTVSSTQCGPNAMTVTFSTVPQAQLDDSNGSTVNKGRVPKLVFKPL